MGAIPNRYYYQVLGAIGELRTRLNRLYPLTLTHDEFLSLLAPEDDRHILKEAARVAHVYAVGGQHNAELSSARFAEFGVESIQLACAVNRIDGTAPLLPRNQVVLQDAPAELRTRIEDWAVARMKQNIEMSRVHCLFAWLCVNCDGAAQLRFLWPTIIALCSVSADLDTNAYGDKLRELRQPRALPPMPAEVRLAFRPTAAIVAGASLLPAQEAPSDQQIPVSVGINAKAAIKEGALGWLSAGA